NRRRRSSLARRWRLSGARGPVVQHGSGGFHLGDFGGGSGSAVVAHHGFGCVERIDHEHSDLVAISAALREGFHGDCLRSVERENARLRKLGGGSGGKGGRSGREQGESGEFHVWGPRFQLRIVS